MLKIQSVQLLPRIQGLSDAEPQSRSAAQGVAKEATVPSSECCNCNVQEVQIMQTLSDIPEVVRCFAYSPQPKALGRSASKVCQLVMELMEVQIPGHTPPSAELYSNHFREVHVDIESASIGNGVKGDRERPLCMHSQLHESCVHYM